MCSTCSVSQWQARCAPMVGCASTPAEQYKSQWLQAECPAPHLCRSASSSPCCMMELAAHITSLMVRESSSCALVMCPLSWNCTELLRFLATQSDRVLLIANLIAHGGSPLMTNSDPVAVSGAWSEQCTSTKDRHGGEIVHTCRASFAEMLQELEGFVCSAGGTCAT